MEMSFIKNALGVVVACTVVGCGGSDRPETVPVSGTLTLGGAAWPAEGRLYFTPSEPAEGYPRKPAQALVDGDGKFNATSFSSGDGLVPGRYRVRVECWKVPPAMEGAAAVSYLHGRYARSATSGLSIDVSADGGPVNVSWDVKPAG